ncbi:MAG TPA: PBP1A family penicillin-binding protein, partial [Gemmatimonadaceae bacterium]|nr:PBP1A family penicillin-binding protein [Gemmatimonadaceae bacterium]
MFGRAALGRRWSRLREVWQAPGVWTRRQRAVVVSLSGVTFGILGLNTWLATCAWRGCPSAAEIRGYQPSEGGRILDRNGKLLGRITHVKRINVRLSSVPRHVRRAFVAVEDRRFYEHEGLDWRGVARAVVRNAASLGVREGFSTITMQVARNTFITARYRGERSVGRKLLELRLARLLERNLTKDQILELYLNAIYLGNGAFGVEAASRDLFGKRVRNLTLAEGALLAALPKGPSAYTPRRDYDRAMMRRNLVLALMEQQKKADPIDIRIAKAEPINLAEKPWNPAAPNESYALDAVRALVDSVLRSVGETGSNVNVYTTIDPLAQRTAERVVYRHTGRIQSEASWWSEDGADVVQGALVALDPRTGDVRALVGGRRYTRGSFNRALAARRQPGSAFKPFVYAAALEMGMTPASRVDDEPITVVDGEQEWTPANYGDEYFGNVTLREALAHSANAATVRVSRSVGEARVVRVASRNGIRSPLRAFPAIALGAVEVTPLELVAAYAPFANGGMRVTPRLIRRIERPDKSEVWRNESATTPVMDPRDAFQLTSMLRAVVDDGTGRAVRAYGVTGPVAGKTGTTNDGTDVWFVGYTPTLVAGVWFGYDVPKSLGYGANGGRYAAPAWAEFYRDGWRERAPRNAWAAPSGLVSREIDPETGKLAGEWCPLREVEWFKVGTQPVERCREHNEPPQHQIDEWIEELGR